MANIFRRIEEGNFTEFFKKTGKQNDTLLKALILKHTNNISPGTIIKVQ